jgi:hypothetical protein
MSGRSMPNSITKPRPYGRANTLCPPVSLTDELTPFCVCPAHPHYLIPALGASALTSIGALRSGEGGPHDGEELVGA